MLPPNAGRRHAGRMSIDLATLLRINWQPRFRDDFEEAFTTHVDRPWPAWSSHALRRKKNIFAHKALVALLAALHEKSQQLAFHPHA
mmetsp:Transcript_1240/g.3131  ORF Transcript_1240/g.3131 Transcript_1240/m.3131 type:complete len:87 (-) Transcript_1240:416-676(-)